MERLAELLQGRRCRVDHVRLHTVDVPADLRGRPLDRIDVEGRGVVDGGVRDVVGVLTRCPREHAGPEIPEDVVRHGRVRVRVFHDVDLAATGPVGGQAVVVGLRRVVGARGRLVARVTEHPESRPRAGGGRERHARLDAAVLEGLLRVRRHAARRLVEVAAVDRDGRREPVGAHHEVAAGLRAVLGAVPLPLAVAPAVESIEAGVEAVADVVVPVGAAGRAGPVELVGPHEVPRGVCGLLLDDRAADECSDGRGEEDHEAPAAA